MEQKHDIVRDILESQQEFANSFNPNSKNYHQGDLTPVPTGGERVPTSMPTVYDQGAF